MRQEGENLLHVMWQIFSVTCTGMYRRGCDNIRGTSASTNWGGGGVCVQRSPGGLLDTFHTLYNKACSVQGRVFYWVGEEASFH